MLDTDHLHRITADLQTVAVTGVDGLDPDALGRVALGARRLRELADHLEVHALGALEPTGHTEATTGLTTGAWFARQAGLPSNIAKTQLTTARALRHLPQTYAAWLDGRLTREHVRVLTLAANPRIRDHIATLEPELIGIAQDHTFHHWRLRITEVVARLDTEGRDPDDPHHTTATWGRTGIFANLRARFAGADVELLEQIIDARTNTLFRANIEEHEQTSDLPLLTRSQLRARAIIDLILHGHDTDHRHHDDHPEHDDDSLRDTNHRRIETDLDDGRDSDSDALRSAATTDRRKRKRKRKRTKTRNPLRVGIDLVLKADTRVPDPHPDVSQLPGTGTTWTLTNPDGRDLPLDHLASVLCDAEIRALLTDTGDNPLNLGRTHRFATPEQRRAVIIRDGGCVMPGCDCPTAWVEIHQVKRYADGGTTDIAVLVALCRRHHGITHRKGWTMHATTDGWFW